MASVAAAAAVAAFAAVPATAHQTFVYDGYNILNAIEVNASDPAIGMDEDVFAGQIQLFGAGADLNRTLDAWCIDLKGVLLPAGSYTFGSSTSAPMPLSAKQRSEIGGLVRWGDLNTGANFYASAAAQMAIWQIAYGSGLTLTAGPVQYAALLVQQAESGKIPGSGWIGLAPTGEASQYLAAAPEPSTWAMMLAGFAGIAYAAAFHRREKRAAVAA